MNLPMALAMHKTPTRGKDTLPNMRVPHKILKKWYPTPIPYRVTSCWKAIKKTPYCANNVKNKHNKYEKEHVPVKEAELDVKRGEYLL